jgi:hypothetical protein
MCDDAGLSIAGNERIRVPVAANLAGAVQKARGVCVSANSYTTRR